MGGLQTAVIAIASAQAASGHVVEIAAGMGRGEKATGLQQLSKSVAVHRFKFSPILSRFSGSLGLFRFLAQNGRRFDVVHVHAVWSLPVVAAFCAAKVARRPVILSPHGSLEPFDTRKHSIAKRVLGPLWVRPLLSKSRLVHCTTRREAQMMITYGARPRRRVVPLPTLPLAPPSRSREEYREALDIPTDAEVLLFLARIDPKKGLEHAIGALALLPENVYLVVAGSGPTAYEQSIRRRVDSLGLDRRVRFVGWLGRDEMSDAFVAADLFVLLSYNENYGITVIEAAQARLPSVMTPDVYASEYLDASGSAVMTDRDPANAAAAIAAALSDPQRMNRLRQGCEQLLESTLSPERSQSEYSRLVVEASSGH
jgi:glycosyltransferase involved in cell wall biosynthesis